MADQIRNMFQSIGGCQNGIGNEKFYLEYEQRKDGMEKSVQSEAETADIGGNDIISFGQRTKDVIKRIVKKLTWKRKLLAWVPLLILLGLFTMGAVVRQEQGRQETEIRKEVEGNDSAVTENVVQELRDNPGIMQMVVSFCLALIASLGAMLIFILLVIALLYFCYLKLLTWWCDRQTAKRCGEYLKTELSNFEQENSLSPKVDAVMQSAADAYERQYMEVYDLSREKRIEIAEINSYLDKMDVLNSEIEELEKQRDELEKKSVKRNICVCGYKLKSQERFCPNCGEAVERDTVTCTCGAKVPAGQFMCMECGRKIED